MGKSRLNFFWYIATGVVVLSGGGGVVAVNGPPRPLPREDRIFWLKYDEDRKQEEQQQRGRKQSGDIIY